MTKAQKAERAEAIETLRGWLPPGATVYTVLRHVSRSGMQREISLHVAEGGELRWITGYAARALDMRIGKRDGIIAGGCGMDMGFHVVSSLSRVLYREGFGCIGDRVTEYRQHTPETCPARSYHETHPDCDHRDSYTARDRCPSNDHSNGDRDYTPHNAPLVAEIVAAGGAPEGAGAANHWHRSGDYALNHRWV